MAGPGSRFEGHAPCLAATRAARAAQHATGMALAAHHPAHRASLGRRPAPPFAASLGRRPAPPIAASLGRRPAPPIAASLGRRLAPPLAASLGRRLAPPLAASRTFAPAGGSQALASPGAAPL